MVSSLLYSHASSGVLYLLELHDLHAGIMFDMSFEPPFEIGTIWSAVSFALWLQYPHL